MQGTGTKKRNILNLMLVAVLSLGIGACSTTTDPIYVGEEQVHDPFEGYNRGVFAFNDAVDTAISRPIAKGYRAVVPQPARTGVRNFLRNLKSPIIIANQLLQGDLEGAGDSATRAAVNTFIGVGGLIDVAEHEGIEYEPEDFGQTLATWGVGHGPYVVAPLFGPGSFRDYTGMVVDAYADPIRLWLFNTDQEEWFYARSGITFVDRHEELMDTLEDLKMSSIDYYAAVRSIYYQHRAALVKDEDPDLAGMADIPDYDSFQ